MKLVRQSLFYSAALYGTSIYILFISIISIGPVFAAPSLSNDVQNIKIVPTAQSQNAIDLAIEIQKGDAGIEKSFWMRYEDSTNLFQKNGDIGGAIQSGFISFDTIIAYAAYLIRLIANLAIAIGAFFVVRGGYEYVLQAFGYKAKTTEYIKNVVIGIFVMMFAYGIIKLLTFTFLQ